MSNFTVLQPPVVQSLDTSGLATKVAVESADKSLRDLIDLLNAGEVTDDQLSTTQATAIANLQALVAQKADKTAVDQAIAAIPTGSAENQTLRTPVATPVPLQVFSGDGSSGVPTPVANAVGSLLVNEGKIHNAIRTSGSDPILTWQYTLSVPLIQLTVPINLRWALPNKSGTFKVKIDANADIWGSGTVNGWNTDTPATVKTYPDGAWTWFEISLPARADAPTQIRLNLPAGQIQLPCIYANGTVTTVTGAVTGMKLVDKRVGGGELTFNPSDFVAKTTPSVWININTTDTDKWFFRPVPGNVPLARLSFQSNIPGDPMVLNFDLEDFATGGATDGYYTSVSTLNGVPIAGPQPYAGGRQWAYKPLLSGTTTAYIIVAVYPSNHFLIAAQLGVGPYTLGRIRNVMANGVAVS
jgi:hypothetical protein